MNVHSVWLVYLYTAFCLYVCIFFLCATILVNKDVYLILFAYCMYCFIIFTPMHVITVRVCTVRPQGNSRKRRRMLSVDQTC